MSQQIDILIVDDNPSMVDTLSDIMAVKGYAVHSAYSGTEALEVLSNHPINILLTDVRMPDMTGVDLFRETKETHPDMITILMTAYAADEIIQEGIAEGIKTVLSKPLDIDFLLTIFSAVSNIIQSDNQAGLS
jgi:DNA-binding NtrC family response regulator